MIQGLSHITLVVRDLEKSAALFEAILDAKVLYSSGDKPFSLAKEIFLDIGSVWLCIMEGKPQTERTYGHVAFRVDDADFDEYVAKIAAAGVEIRPPRPRVEGEGRSIYFYDWDGHLFELHAGTLGQRLARYAG